MWHPPPNFTFDTLIFEKVCVQSCIEFGGKAENSQKKLKLTPKNGKNSQKSMLLWAFKAYATLAFLAKFTPTHPLLWSIHAKICHSEPPLYGATVMTLLRVYSLKVLLKIRRYVTCSAFHQFFSVVERIGAWGSTTIVGVGLIFEVWTR